MNKNTLKQFVRTALIEKLETPASVSGKLIKKTLGFSGIVRECVCEGTINEANEYATQHDLTFEISENSYFGGHFVDEMISYEFQPNPEFYGELMETRMSAREQLARICGTNDKILTEVDSSKIENLIEFIFTDEDFKSQRTDVVCEYVKNNISNKLYDKTQYKRMFEYLIKTAITEELSEPEFEYALSLISTKMFEGRLEVDIVNETEAKCGKKSFKTGNAFENMQRIVSGHQMFL
jgi:hypothetical protein